MNREHTSREPHPRFAKPGLAWTTSVEKSSLLTRMSVKTGNLVELYSFI
jgi:hypothetical protein